MKIAVLISGGVDSALVVDLLYKQGHELHLFYIRIGMDNDEGDCSAEEDIEMCSLIADRYDLPLRIVSLHQEYWDYVMKYALKTVEKGLTPNPDMMCNKFIKFGFFEERYGKDYDLTATGHYASIRTIKGKKYLGTAIDAVKDQTDFLSAISYRQLEHLMFPLGEFTKEEVRKMAREVRLPNAMRKDSQGICFLGKIDYSDFLKRKLGVRKGNIVDIATGKVLGEHNGYWFHTIGQRKGLGLGGGPWFVVKKDVARNIIFVSHGYDTPLQYSRRIHIDGIHWITNNPFDGNYDKLVNVIMSTNGGLETDIMFKNRHTPEFIRGRLFHSVDGDMILSEKDVQGVAPGQYITLYTVDKRICLGSAMISAWQHDEMKNTELNC